MPVRVKCKKCKHVFEVSSIRGGEKIRCPECEHLMAVRSKSPTSSDDSTERKQARPIKQAKPLEEDSAPPAVGDRGTVSIDLQATPAAATVDTLPRSNRRTLLIVLTAAVLVLAGIGVCLMAYLGSSEAGPSVADPGEETDQPTRPPKPRKRSSKGGGKRSSTGRSPVSVAQQSVVLLDIKVAGETRQAYGVVIDDRGSIVAPFSDLAGVTQGSALFGSGHREPLAAVFDDDQSLAFSIVRLAQVPEDLTVVAISPAGTTKKGQIVYGLTRGKDGELTRINGTLGEVKGHRSLLVAEQVEVRKVVKGGKSLRWLRHNLVSPPPERGTPILNSQGKMVALHMTVATVSTGKVGLAIDAGHVLELLDRTTGNLRPLTLPKVATGAAPPTGGLEPVPPKSELAKLAESVRVTYEQGEAFGWKATDVDQYAKLQQFARAMTNAGMVREDSTKTQEERDGVGKEFDAVMRKLRSAASPNGYQANEDQINSTNALASKQITKGGDGVFFFGEVIKDTKKNLNERQLFAVRMIGTDAVVLLPISRGAEMLTPKSRWLVMGVRPAATTAPVMLDGVERQVFYVFCKALLRMAE